MKISTTQYAKSLYEVTAEKSKHEIDGVVAGFLKVLRKKNQMKLTKKIIEKFSEIYNKKNGIVEAEITSRELLSGAVRTKVRTKVRTYVSTKYQAKEVVINNKIDESIKGGIIIKVGDEILDGSVARQLNDLKIAISK